MFRLISLVVTLAIGFGGGIYVGINNPEFASKFNDKQQEWVRQGKEQALTELKKVLNEKLATADTTPAATPGKGFASGFASGGTGGSTGKSEADTLKSLSAVVDSQLSQVKK